MSTDIKVSKFQLTKITQLGGLLGKTPGNLGRKALLDILVPAAKDILLILATNLANEVNSLILDKFENN